MEQASGFPSTPDREAPSHPQLGSLLPTPGFSWLSLDENDNDLIRFLTYLIAALQTIEADIGQGALSALQSPQPPPNEAILTTLIAFSSQPRLAGGLLVPYLAWVSFAAVLNFAIWRLNAAGA